MLKLDKSLVRGSFILIIGFGIFNLLNFLFHFLMARGLSLEEYGILASLFSINYILGIFMESIQIVITKYSTEEKSDGKLKNLFKKSLRKATSASLFVFILYLLLSFPLSYLLKIKLDLLIINGMIIFFIFFLPVSRGVMQGTKKFNLLSANMIVESLAKIIFALIFLYFGMKIYGAVLGSISGASVAFFVSIISLRGLLQAKEEKAPTKGIYDYTKPAFFITLIIFAFYNMDILLAKIAFPAETAGAYAIASMLGKMIFLITQPVSKAMFPISSEEKLDKVKSRSLIFGSLLITILMILAALILFYLFPEILVKIFSGRTIENSSAILVYLGIAFSLLSFANLKLLYDLSINRIRGYPYLLIFLILEIAVLIIFSNNLLEYSLAFIFSSLIFLIGSIIILRKAD